MRGLGGNRMIRYVVKDDKLTASTFLQLVQSVWPGDYDLEKTKQALKQTINISAYDGEKLVGCVRLLTDGYFFTTVSEILVLPEYQKQGIGQELMNLAYSISPSSIFLGAQKGNEGFFEKLGYIYTMAGYVKRKERK
jgi:ribosomal protein S18 acetylase RimI-like enzyme